MKSLLPSLIVAWLMTGPHGPATGQVVVGERPQAEAATRESRLRTHVAVFQDWTARTCDLSEQQRADVRARLDEQLRNAGHHAETPALEKGGPALSALAPIMFTLEANDENVLCNSRVTGRISELLTEKQRPAWFDALNERREAIRAANLDFVVHLVDEDFVLTDEQLESMKEALRSAGTRTPQKIRELDIGLFSFPTDNAVLPQVPLYPWFWPAGRASLSPEQQHILDIRQADYRFASVGSQKVELPWPASPNREERLTERMVAFLETQRAEFTGFTENRVAALSADWPLADNQKRYLAVAGKGATQRCFDSWKKEVRELLADLLKEFANAGTFFRDDEKISWPAPSVFSMEHDLVWQHAVRKVTSTVAAQRRRPFHREAIVGYVTAMLDKELWLTADQREPLSDLVDAAFPRAIEIGQPRVKELELLIVPLFGIPDDQLASVLRESQLAAWKILQAQFERDGSQVILPLTDGQSLTFQIAP